MAGITLELRNPLRKDLRNSGNKYWMWKKWPGWRKRH
jgi:hypothetical protein